MEGKDVAYEDDVKEGSEDVLGEGDVVSQGVDAGGGAFILRDVKVEAGNINGN